MKVFGVNNIVSLLFLGNKFFIWGWFSNGLGLLFFVVRLVRFL